LLKSYQRLSPQESPHLLSDDIKNQRVSLLMIQFLALIVFPLNEFLKTTNILHRTMYDGNFALLSLKMTCAAPSSVEFSCGSLLGKICPVDNSTRPIPAADRDKNSF
jgi:hypothetical protein